MRSTYGTANNKEYQQRISQLQELDRQILGRGRARRIYKDILAKPATLCGGTYIELPAELLDLRFSASMSR